MAIKNLFVLFASVFLTVSSLGAAEPFDLNDYADGSCYTAILALDAEGDKVPRWEEIVKGSPGFNHKKDSDIIRSSMSGLYTRKAFIKLSDADFVKVVNNALPFFSKPFGFSLIHGWMLNKFKDSTTPYYIGTYFSFDKFFFGMIGKMPVNVQNIIKKAWFSARKDVEKSRWDYYDHMLYLPYAIEQAGGAKEATAPSMDPVIMGAHISEAADLKFYNQSLTSFWSYVNPKITSLFVASVSEPSLIFKRVEKFSPSIENQEEVFTNIMGWVISHYDIGNSPVFKKINEDTFDINTFVEFVIEHVPSLNEKPDAAGHLYKSEVLAKYAQKILESLQRTYGAGAPSFIKSCLSEVIRKISRSSSKRKGLMAINAVNFGTGFDQVFKTKRNKGVRKSSIARPTPDTPKKHATPIKTLKEEGGITWSNGTPLIEDSKKESRFEECEIYITPVDWTYDAEKDESITGDDASDLQNKQLLANQSFINGLTRYRLADILKTWETYLDKGKRYIEPQKISSAADKSPCIEGTNPLAMLPGMSYFAAAKRAQLSQEQVKEWRHALLATNNVSEVRNIRSKMMEEGGPRSWRNHMIGNMKTDGFMG